jgi:hypothetical protein
MIDLGDAQKLLSFIPATKVKSFAALARTLDISEFRDFKLSKRRTLLLCLLYQAQVKTRDHLVEIEKPFPSPLVILCSLSQSSL